MSTKKINWLKKLGIKTLQDMKLYLELRKAFRVRETLELMYLVEVE